MNCEICQDIPRIYTGIAEWTACFVYILLIADRRKETVRKSVVCVLFLFALPVYLAVTGSIPIAFWVPCMAGAAFLMLVFLKAASGKAMKKILFAGGRAFLLAEFAASLEWQLHVIVFDGRHGAFRWDQILLMLAAYGVIFAGAFYMERKMKTEEYLENLTGKDCVMSAVIAVLAFAVSNLSFVFSSAPYTAEVRNYIFTIRTLVDLCGIALMCILQSRVQELMAEREIARIHRALKSQYEQYRTYQEGFETMNIKYHDLKHQIAGLRSETNETKKKEWLDEMERELDVLSDVGHTGNAVLDGILAAKMGYCRKNKIKVTCVADGSLLSRIHVADLCTIFGNALDNAVESVSMIPEEEKRLIYFSVSRQKSFIFIRMENCCEQELKIGRELLPETSKPDKKEHGYGMKSIRQTVEKYHGSMDYGLKEGWFELKILIPYTIYG